MSEWVTVCDTPLEFAIEWLEVLLQFVILYSFLNVESL